MPLSLVEKILKGLPFEGAFFGFKLLGCGEVLMMRCSNDIVALVIYAGISVLAYGLYSFGLNGPYLLDDMSSLQGLQVNDLQSFLGYVFGSDTGPTGRPLAMLSFFIDEQYLPSEAYSFKYTNILCHLLAGLLLWWLIYRLVPFFKVSVSRGWCATFVAGFWLLSPLQISSVLYVIQRMTLLSFVFGLCAMHMWLSLRMDFDRSRWLRRAGQYLGFVFFVVCALLSKEVAVTIFLLVLLLECSLFGWRLRGVNSIQFLAVAPVVCCVLYILWAFPASVRAYEYREYSLLDKLLLWPEVMLYYLSKALFVDVSVSNVYCDQLWRAGASLAGFLKSSVLLLLLAGLGFSLSGRSRLFWLGLAWFVLAHLLESSYIPIEPCFEHRNYWALPGVGLMLFSFLVQIKRLWGSSVCILVAAAVLGLSGWLLGIGSKTWSDEGGLSLTWGLENPKSIRSQRHYANYLEQVGLQHGAVKVYDEILRMKPGDVAALVEVLRLDCDRKGDVLSLLEARGESADLTVEVIGALNSVQASPRALQCLSGSGADRLATAILGIKKSSMLKLRGDNAAMLHYRLGQIYEKTGFLSAAMAQMDLAFTYTPVIDIVLNQVVMLISAGVYDQAKTYLQKAEAINDRQAFGYSNRLEDIVTLKSALQSAILSNSLGQG